MNKGYLFILTTAFLFGTMETALKFFGSLFHPIQITVLRFFIGGFMLLPLARAALKTHGAVLTKKDYLFFAKAGFIGVFVSMIFYQLAVVYGKAAVSGVLFSCNPIFVAVWAHFLLHETIDRYVISSLVLSAVGILSIVNPFHFRGTYLSVILIMLAAVTFGLYSVMGRPACQRLGGVTVTSYSFIFGAAELLVLVLLGRTAPIGHLLTSVGLSVFADVPLLETLTPSHLPALCYIAFAVTGAGYASYFMAIELTNPLTASLAFFIKPILATFFAAMFLGETVMPNMLVGVGLILIGSLTNLYPKLKAK